MTYKRSANKYIIKKFLFFNLLILLPFLGFSQKNSFFQLTIRVNEAFGGVFVFSIFKDKKNVKIVFKIKDSTNTTLFDSAVNSSNQNIIKYELLKNKYDLKKCADSLTDFMYNKCFYYTMDSLQFKIRKIRNYNKLLKNLEKNYIDTVFAKDSTFFFDADRLNVNLKVKKRENKFYIVAPNLRSYEVLNKVIFQAFDMYQKIRNNDFLHRIRFVRRYSDLNR